LAELSLWLGNSPFLIFLENYREYGKGVHRIPVKLEYKSWEMVLPGTAYVLLGSDVF
jgi:hypothetical protein